MEPLEIKMNILGKMLFLFLELNELLVRWQISILSNWWTVNFRFASLMLHNCTFKDILYEEIQCEQT